MQLTRNTTPLATTDADALVVGVFSGESLTGPAAEADRATDGILARLIKGKEITGKKYETVPLLAPPGVAAGQIVVVGLGERLGYDAGTAFRAASAAARALAGKPRERVAYFLDGGDSPARTEAAVAGAMVGCVGQDLYKAEKKRTPPKELLWSGGDPAAIERGGIVGESVNLTRRLVTEPPKDMNPASFAAKATQMANQCGLKAEIWDQARLEKERCGSLLAVAKGSDREPRLAILHSQRARAKDSLLALAGKGVAFESD